MGRYNIRSVLWNRHSFLKLKNSLNSMICSVGFPRNKYKENENEKSVSHV